MTSTESLELRKIKQNNCIKHKTPFVNIPNPSDTQSDLCVTFCVKVSTLGRRNKNRTFIGLVFSSRIGQFNNFQWGACWQQTLFRPLEASWKAFFHNFCRYCFSDCCSVRSLVYHCIPILFSHRKLIVIFFSRWTHSSCS